jgi:NADH:ubiquinone oxidoreductase subunit D
LDLDLDLIAVKVPPAVRELQGNSERWRQRATNVGMDPEANGGPWLVTGGGLGGVGGVWDARFFLDLVHEENLGN